MKTPEATHSRHGFTLIELLVAMTITTIIVTVLVSITSIAIDTWNRSRAELRAARQAKTMVDSMARDFEALVVRKGNANEWLSATVKQPSGDSTSTNAASLVFFTAATDRYNGEIGKQGVDLGGDVSCVGYELNWKDPIQGGAGGNFKTFVLNRLLVDPKPTFDNLLGKSEIGDLFASRYGADLAKIENFLCENVFQFTVTFNVEIPPVTTGTGTGSAQPTNKIVTIKPSGGTTKFSIKGTGIESTPVDDTLKTGRITSVGISLTVLSDSGVEALRKNSNLAQKADWLAKNSFQYSKLIQIPGM
jgi:prepilin-type N-terminal cleavage/methylation domain-containing protein